MTRLLFATTVPVTLEAFLLPLADACSSRGWTVDAVAAGATSRERLAKHFHNLHNADWSRSPTSPRNLRALTECTMLLRRGTYDIVHVHTPVAAFVLRMAAKLTRYPGQIVYTAHGFHFTETGNRISNGIFLALEKIGGRNTTRLIVINRDDQATALQKGFVSADRVVHINGVGVDAERFSSDRFSEPDREAARRGLGLIGRQVVTMIAEFNPGKRHLDLIEAIPMIKSRHPSVIFVFAGTGPLLPLVRARASELGVAGSTRFLGFWSNIPQLLSITDLTVLPSIREGLPVSLMEAMAMGIPFVGCNIRGVRDLADGGCGLLVPPRSSGALADAIVDCLSDPERARTAGMIGRAKVMEKFEQHLIIRQHMQLYESLLGLTN